MDATTQVLASTVLSGLDLWEPEHNATLFRPYGDQGASWFITQQLLGNETPVSQEEYYAWEEGRIHESFKVRTGIGAPGAGNDAVFVVAVANVDASNKFYPQVGDDVKFANRVSGYIRSISVSSPSAPELTVAPHNIATDIGALQTNDDVIIYSNSWGEGSVQPQSRISKPTKRTGHLKIIKTTLSATGTEMTNSIRVKVMDGGGNFLGWYDKTRQIDLDFRHNLAISHALLVDELVTNTSKVVDAQSTAGNAVAYGTEGLLTAMAARGLTDTVATATLALTDFYDYNLLLTKQHNSSNVIALCGNKIMQQINKVLFAANANSNASWLQDTIDSGIVGDEGDVRAKAMAINVKSLMLDDNRMWHFKNMNEFNNPETLGLDTFTYRDTMAVIPTGMTPDAKSRKLIPYSGIRYKKLGSYNRRMEIWSYGAAGEGPKVGPIDVKHDYMRTHIGAEHVCVNKMLLVGPA